MKEQRLFSEFYIYGELQNIDVPSVSVYLIKR